MCVCGISTSSNSILLLFFLGVSPSHHTRFLQSCQSRWPDPTWEEKGAGVGPWGWEGCPVPLSMATVADLGKQEA